MFCLIYFVKNIKSIHNYTYTHMFQYGVVSHVHTYLIYIIGVDFNMLCVYST